MKPRSATSVPANLVKLHHLFLKINQGKDDVTSCLAGAVRRLARLGGVGDRRVRRYFLQATDLKLNLPALKNDTLSLELAENIRATSLTTLTIWRTEFFPCKCHTKEKHEVTNLEILLPETQTVAPSLWSMAARQGRLGPAEPRNLRSGCSAFLQGCNHLIRCQLPSLDMCNEISWSVSFCLPNLQSATNDRHVKRSSRPAAKGLSNQGISQICKRFKS